jgi:hypothetical protein
MQAPQYTKGARTLPLLKPRSHQKYIPDMDLEACSLCRSKTPRMKKIASYRFIRQTVRWWLQYAPAAPANGKPHGLARGLWASASTTLTREQRLHPHSISQHLRILCAKLHTNPYDIFLSAARLRNQTRVFVPSQSLHASPTSWIMVAARAMLLSRSTPAQSQLLTFTLAFYVLLTASSSFRQSFAYASELPAASAIDAISQPLLPTAPIAVPQVQEGHLRSDGGEGYAPDFDYFDRSLLGRQEPQGPQIKELKNNQKEELDINPGQTAYFVLKKGRSRLVRTDEADLEALEARGTVNVSDNPLDDEVASIDAGKNAEVVDAVGQLEKRQAAGSFWISANTCRQPNPPPLDQAEKSSNNPQLVMYISTSSRNQRPGPDSTDGLATPPTGLLFENGFASFALQAMSDIYIGISAPNLDDGWFGSWSFELAASSNGFYHSYNGTNPYLYMIDTDSDSALFITYNLSETNANDTDKWIRNNPFKMYAFENESITNITGLERSMCAVQYYNQSTNVSMETSITTKFGGALPKAQFHLQGLKAGKTYNGFLTVGGQQDVLRLPGNTTVRGGGMIFQQFDFTTKAGKCNRSCILKAIHHADHSFQTTIAKSSSTSNFATQWPTPFPQIPTTKTTTTSSKPSMTTKQKNTIATSPTPLRKSLATLYPKHNTLLHAPAKTAKETTRTGFAPSSYRVAKTGARLATSCRNAMLTCCFLMAVSLLKETSQPK